MFGVPWILRYRYMYAMYARMRLKPGCGWNVGSHSIIIHHSEANPAFSARPAPDYPDYLDVFVVVPCICPFACGCPYVEILIKPAGIDSVVETTRQIGELYAVSY